MQQTGNIRVNKSGETTSDLICPRCGGDYLHHMGATFFERGEDEKQEVVIDVSGASVKSAIGMAGVTGNPSSRRHGMVIHFDCEGCSSKGGKLQLALAQHKGQTEISWLFDPINI